MNYLFLMEVENERWQIRRTRAWWFGRRNRKQ
jgi:hypothetical protein